MERVLTEAYSGIDDRRRLVIRDAEALRKFWADATTNRLPAPEVPAVDFENEMVIAASMGRRGTGGYGIEIETVSQVGEELRVVVVETAPGEGCFLTQALSAPVVAVKVPRSAATVRFEERTVTQDCN
ncbi:MAG: protease complex subunit PrcB family protein [Gemmatimonadota bacterium]|nr:MAG: protease complex subunit PrcB family protein [Gemmatimonadota bacterium]